VIEYLYPAYFAGLLGKHLSFVCIADRKVDIYG